MAAPYPLRTGTYMVDGTRVSFTNKQYTLGDFELQVASGDTKDLTADGTYEQVYTLDVEQGLGEVFGRGVNQNPLQAQGFIGIRLVSDAAAAQANGRYRIAVRNAQGRRLFNLYEGDLSTDDLFTGAAGSGTKKDRRDREPFPQTDTVPTTEPFQISIDVDVTSDITVDDAEAETALEADGYRGEALN